MLNEKVTFCFKNYSQMEPNKITCYKQFNQEQISLNRLTAKDVKFDLLRCQAFNRDRCVKIVLVN